MEKIEKKKLTKEELIELYYYNSFQEKEFKRYKLMAKILLKELYNEDVEKNSYTNINNISI